jgi:hypothetical protein
MSAYMAYRDDNSGVEFRWHGGEYIDIGSVVDIAGQPGIHGDDFHAYDVINVWDYAAGKPRIPRTLDAFEQRCREKVAELASEDES